MSSSAPTPTRSEARQVKRAARQYQQYNLWLVAALTLLVLMAARVGGLTGLAVPLAVCAVYSLLMGMAYGAVWRHVMLTRPSSVTHFYMAAPLVRLVIGLLVCAEYGLLVYSKTAVVRFVALFAAYYAVSRVFDAVYFARVEKKNTNNKE